MKTRTVDIVNVNEWNKLVSDTYGKVYNFQQQQGCQARGFVEITIPDKNWEESEMNDNIPEVINDEKNMGVKFYVWLDRDPNEPLNPTKNDLDNCNYYYGKTKEDEKEWKHDKSHINLFWERNFYPCLQSVANDLYKKGLITKGNYLIEIDW